MPLERISQQASETLISKQYGLIVKKKKKIPHYSQNFGLRL